ncbi:anti-sigma regulatory factor (Ser/Thr protein kinase) [Kitasatospora sp. MAA4]|uniref:ATP-binding protein n=1 Tax=Kitasatospora sp. MAA4 TaxID=3035093 RepID=UPI0024747C8F|nr:ATP-binding protein [Kitasatospora sp. MAA4]MDH6137463.1 anti-sigma regulatory factor (Ser/Thr protein kinase) [Kitasatospora sp. MAA4]
MAVSRIELNERTPAPAGEDECWLPRSPKSPGFARKLLDNLLARVEGGERFAEAGELVASELVANAVRHGTRRDQLVWVHLDVDEVRLRIEVHDASSTYPVVQGLDLEQESGRGLLLVEELSERWGCGPRPVGIGKVVWAVVPAARGGC